MNDDSEGMWKKHASEYSKAIFKCLKVKLKEITKTFF